jgi:hypothetical protein
VRNVRDTSGNSPDGSPRVSLAEHDQSETKCNSACPRHASPHHPCLPILPPQRGRGRRVAVVVAVVVATFIVAKAVLLTPRGHGRHVAVVAALSSPPLVAATWSGWWWLGVGYVGNVGSMW